MFSLKLADELPLGEECLQSPIVIQLHGAYHLVLNLLRLGFWKPWSAENILAGWPKDAVIIVNALFIGIVLHSLHVSLLIVLRAAIDSTTLVLLHHLNVILDAFKLLLKETLLLPNRLYFKPIPKQRIQMLLIVDVCSVVQYVDQIGVVQRLGRIFVVVKMLVSIRDRWHVILGRVCGHTDLVRLKTGSLLTL